MLLALISFLPFFGFLFNFTIGVRVLSKKSHGPSPIVGAVACLSVLLSFLLAVWAVIEAHGAPDHTISSTLWTWIPGGLTETVKGSLPFRIDWAYEVDPLSSVMVLVVTYV